MPSSAAATRIQAIALSHSPETAKRTPVRPEHRASAVIALGTTARSGIPRRGTARLSSLMSQSSLGDALDQLGDADPADDRLAGDGALAEQHLRRGAGGQIDVDPAAEADQADALAGADPVA